MYVIKYFYLFLKIKIYIRYLVKQVLNILKIDLVFLKINKSRQLINSFESNFSKIIKCFL